MKKIKLIITSMLFLLIAVSCEKDGGTSVIDFTEGGAPNIQKIATTDQGLNVVALKSGQNINLGLTIAVARGNVSSMDIVGFYTKGAVVEKAVLKANVTSFPPTENFTQTDLYNAFNLLNSANDVGLSDKLVISADLTLNDGTVIKMFTDKGVPNYGADIANSLQFKVSQTYIVSCPLTDASIFNGNYKVTADQWQDYSVNDIVPVVYNAANGLLNFRILSTTNPSATNAGTPYMIVTINPVTATVTKIVSSGPYFYPGDPTGYSVTAGTGTLSSCTGDMNLKVTWGAFGTYTFNLVKL